MPIVNQSVRAIASLQWRCVALAVLSGLGVATGMAGFILVIALLPPLLAVAWSLLPLVSSIGFAVYRQCARKAEGRS